MPEEARGTYKPAACEILPVYQNLEKGEIIPDGPPGSAYYNVIDLKQNHLLLLHVTSHFKYMALQFLYKTRFAPRGSFCWAFIVEKIEDGRSQLISRWQAKGYPKAGFMLFKPFLILMDGAHQRQILQGIKRRVETRSYYG